MMAARTLIVVVLLLSIPAAATPQTPAARPAAAPAIQPGSTVLLEYTVKDDAGTVIDTNKGQGPLTYVQGDQQLVPGLEQALSGMRVGQEKKIVVKPEDAYGTVNPAALAEVPKRSLPSSGLTVGATLMARDANGRSRPATVKAIKDDTVVLDLNHPLAGKTLVFEIKVLGVEPPGSGAPKPAK